MAPPLDSEIEEVRECPCLSFASFIPRAPHGLSGPVLMARPWTRSWAAEMKQTPSYCRFTEPGGVGSGGPSDSSSDSGEVTEHHKPDMEEKQKRERPC